MKKKILLITSAIAILLASGCSSSEEVATYEKHVTKLEAELKDLRIKNNQLKVQNEQLKNQTMKLNDQLKMSEREKRNLFQSDEKEKDSNDNGQ